MHLTMIKSAALLAFSALWGRSEAQSGDASAASIMEQYCFPKSGAPFSTNSLQPSVTMMYGSMTLTTAPLTLTMCAMESPTGIPGGSANSVTISRLTDASPLPDETGTGTGSASGSISSALTLSVSVSGSTVTTASDGTQAMGSILETSTSATTTVSNSAVDSSDGSLVSSRQPTVSPSGNGIISNDQSVTSLSASDGSQLVSGAASSASIGGSGAPIATVATSNPPEVSSLVELSPGGNTPTPTGLGSLPTFLASTQASASAGLYRPTGSLLGVGASQQNGTISLPPLSIDALKLALFLKNLGVWTFNESRIAELSSLTARQEREGLASLVADIAVQEQTQLKTLRMLLLQSGNIDVPSCQYDLPKNITELSFLMVTLKSINLGVFMSMAEAAERPVAILLSSIASVEAKHIALLSDHTHHNASAQSFDTPATPAWAYNIALQYSQPGSCSVQLPLPILPKLTINNHTFAHVQPGAKVSVEWGAAAGYALDQVGRRAFVAWVNQVAQPIFTPLDLLNEGVGDTMVPDSLSGTAFAVLTAQEGLTSIADLTAATLAGPLVVNSQP
ncbi:hypothetical protein COCHEDRAFT_1228186 [Bipolaris maydis C5]|uniref:Uncharacterized protein n=1 Tax=Cochliobolus heterostrophus (strain C5 / ATCC 48332 / race O) TaxID=701091 RepID=M2UFQ8_COCH5|nr:hypothetical protein COCHEDRAFT_1228186 [Bipolaris maydis C5]KAJ6203664.1 hypothetical protein PSV09DRAFT_1228186 [Bipolaris maydis]KAJ6267329.1 hypothetical protein PSV08DRAFT_208213 [Bipolaris maydis]KAJ6267713.1 hypothetical protein PSV08DRAFT_411915 [Bipolaris maydis]